MNKKDWHLIHFNGLLKKLKLRKCDYQIVAKVDI